LPENPEHQSLLLFEDAMLSLVVKGVFIKKFERDGAFMSREWTYLGIMSLFSNFYIPPN